jgi:hypothetical protein
VRSEASGVRRVSGQVLNFGIKEEDSGRKLGAALDTLVKKDDERSHQGNDAKNNKGGKKKDSRGHLHAVKKIAQPSQHKSYGYTTTSPAKLKLSGRANGPATSRAKTTLLIQLLAASEVMWTES